MSLQLRAIIVAVSIAAGFLAGWQVQGWRKDASLLQERQRVEEASERARQAARDQESAVAAAQSIEAELAVERRKKAKIVERVITNDVIKYVQTPAATRCGVDAGGVRIINAAAAGRVPEDADTAGTPDDRTGDASAGEVVASVTGNYATCNDTREQLLELQGWVRSLAASR